MNKKNNLILLFIIASLSLIIFSGCDRGPKKITEAIDIISINHDDVIKKDEAVLIEYTIKYPQIKEAGNHTGLVKINEFYKEQFNEMTEKDYQESKRMAEEDYQEAIEAGYDFRNHALGNDFEVTYNNDGLLSINNIEYTYWGGAHPNSFRESSFFDINTGQKLTLGKLLNKEEDKALKDVLAEVRKQIEEKGTDGFYLFEDAKELLEDSYYENDFYFDGENLVIYFQQYAIAPYAAGFPEFKIPKKDIPYLKKRG